MKSFIFIFLVLTLNSFSWSQKELVNVYNSYSEVHGGMEDSGISRTESFTFVAKKTIELKDIFYNGEKIILKKGDTLVVNMARYMPYNSQPYLGVRSDSVDVKIPEVSGKDRFNVIKVGSVYYAVVLFPYAWPGIIEYVYKKKVYASKIKQGFDKGNTFYAP